MGVRGTLAAGLSRRPCMSMPLFSGFPLGLANAITRIMYIGRTVLFRLYRQRRASEEKWHQDCSRYCHPVVTFLAISMARK